MTTSARVGVVLAGGFSTRFGEEDKLLVTLDGRPLLVHAIEGVGTAVDGIVVNCREEQLDEFRPLFEHSAVPVAPAPDPVPDRGPAAGIATALETVSAPVVAVVAGDMPFVDGDFLATLFDRIEDADGVVPEIDGCRQPTLAVYRTDALQAAAAAAIEDGDGSLRSVLAHLDVHTIPAATVQSLTAARTFSDVNTVEDLAAARELLSDTR